jgi:hypothetical protein
LNASRVCATVIETVLPGTCFAAASGGDGFAPGAAGGLTVYAHGGGTGLSWEESKDARATAIAEWTTIAAIRILLTARF